MSRRLSPSGFPARSFLFPEDQQIELEYWAESGEFTQTELHQMKVQENRLFSISPRTGNLQPGQQRAVQFTYRLDRHTKHVTVSPFRHQCLISDTLKLNILLFLRHNFAGTYRLPVLLKVSHGREILVRQK